METMYYTPDEVIEAIFAGMGLPLMPTAHGKTRPAKVLLQDLEAPTHYDSVLGNPPFQPRLQNHDKST